MKLFFEKNKNKIISERRYRYILSGLFSFGVENLSFLFFYYLLTIPPVKSNVLSILVALIVNFYTTKYFVFRNKTTKKNALKQAVAYVALVNLNILISTYMIVVLIDSGVAAYIAKPIITAATITWTYLLYNRVIFKKGK